MKKLSEHIISAGGLLDDYIANEPYVVEKVWEKIEIEPINVVIANGKE